MTSRKCTANNCDRKHFAWGYCRTHYGRAKAGREVNAPIKTPRKKGEFIKCSVGDCENNIKAKGLCQKHYTRVMVHGDPTVNLRPHIKCSVEHCERYVKGRGLCSMHLTRVQRTGKIGSWRTQQEERDSLFDSFAEIEWAYSTQELRDMAGMSFRYMISNLQKRNAPQEVIDRLSVQRAVEERGYRRRYRAQRRAKATASGRSGVVS